MNKTGLIAIFATGIIILVIVVAGNFNIEVNVGGKGNQVSAPQDDSMASHHSGAAIPADATVFNNLVGKPASDFTLETYDGNQITLSSLKGKNVILFFNEGLMCYPACWNQIAAFGKDEELGQKAVILNITADPKNNWKEALDKMPELAQATTLFDSNRQVSTIYGVLTLPSSMHKGQFPGHSYVIINKDGIIKFVKDDVQMTVRNQELSAEVDNI